MVEGSVGIGVWVVVHASNVCFVVYSDGKCWNEMWPVIMCNDRPVAISVWHALFENVFSVKYD